MTCFAPVKGRTARFTRLDECGAPVLGPDSVIVTKGIVTVGFTAENTTIDAIQVPNFEGINCVDVPEESTPNGYSIDITFCDVNPELYAMLSGQPVIYDDNDEPIGIDVEYDRKPGRFAAEFWTGVAGMACGSDGLARSGYLVLGFVQGGVLGDFTLENGAVSFQITGARTLKGSQWGEGPYNVQLDGAGLPIPLTPPLSDLSALRIITVTLPPPEAQCDAQPLGTPATGADAGSPGEWTPANSYAPLNLAELVLADPVADPVTAWGPTQYVILRDGSRATWDGDDWVAFTV